MTEIGAYTPETSKMVLDVIAELKRSGFMPRDGVKVSQISPSNPATPPIYVRNDSGGEIPAYACMQVSGTAVENSRTYLTVVQPTDEYGDNGEYVFNLHHAIPAAEYGLATNGLHARTLSEDPTASSGSRLQPRKGTWKMYATTEGRFAAIGADDLGAEVQKVAVRAERCERIHFVLTSAVSSNSYNATIEEHTAGTSEIPGMSGATVTVVDNMGCLVLATGLHGWATWVQTWGASPAVGFWSIDSLCCP